MSSADAGVNSMAINGGIVWTIVVFIGRLALYTQVDASQGCLCLKNRITNFVREADGQLQCESWSSTDHFHFILHKGACHS